MWKKIIEEASYSHRRPVLFTDDGSQKSNKTWCIIQDFAVDDTWERREFKKKFKTNITISHEDLLEYYPSGSDEHICYIVDMGDLKVCILPLRLFYEMFK